MATVPSRQVGLDRPFFRIPAAATTLAGFRAWIASDDFPRNVRAALIDREIYLDMSQEELETHVAVKTEVARVLSNLNREVQLGKFYGDGVQIVNETAELASQPDAVFVRWKSLESGQARLVPRQDEAGQYIEIEGTPDWVLEVVSDSSVHKDRVQLRDAYYRAGISEYWLIDARRAQLVFQILYRRKTGYAVAARHDGWQRSRVFDGAFQLVRERDRLGLWDYTLEVRPGKGERVRTWSIRPPSA